MYIAVFFPCFLSTCFSTWPPHTTVSGYTTWLSMSTPYCSHHLYQPQVLSIHELYIINIFWGGNRNVSADIWSPRLPYTRIQNVYKRTKWLVSVLYNAVQYCIRCHPQMPSASFQTMKTFTNLQPNNLVICTCY